MCLNSRGRVWAEVLVISSAWNSPRKFIWAIYLLHEEEMCTPASKPNGNGNKQLVDVWEAIANAIPVIGVVREACYGGDDPMSKTCAPSSIRQEGSVSNWVEGSRGIVDSESEVQDANHIPIRAEFRVTVTKNGPCIMPCNTPLQKVSDERKRNEKVCHELTEVAVSNNPNIIGFRNIQKSHCCFKVLL